MKKTLALVLALVMVIGMMAVPASAAYTDAADIQYKEAVDVMSAIGVIEGYNNEFNPKGELTRAAGAKLVAYLELGAKGAEALTAEKAPFADVPADHWAAGYIGWAASKGYINGVGDDMFAPDAPLTALAYAKLLLCALGYDAAIEGLTGNGWEYNVLALALDADIDLFDGNEDADFAAVATREEAALYSFNALKAPMVSYKSKGTQVEINGAVISTGASDYEVVKNNGTEKIFDNEKMELAEKRYSKLELTEGTADKFGRPATKWTYDEDSVGTYTEAALAVYAGADFDDETLENDFEDYSDVNENAVDADAFDVAVKYNGATVDRVDLAFLEYGIKGMTIEVYGDEDEETIDLIVAYEAYVAQITDVTTDDDDEITEVEVTIYEYTFEGDGVEITVDVEDDEDAYKLVKGYEEDDFFMIYVKPGFEDMSANKSFMKVADVDTFEGEVTASQLDDYMNGWVKIDGEKYYIANEYANINTIATKSEGLFYTFQGLIVHFDGEANKEENYAFVLRTAEDKDAWTNATYLAEVVFTDGTTAIVECDVDSDDADAVAAFKAMTNAIVEYEVDDDVYTLVDLEIESAGALDIEKGKVALGADGKTEYIVIELDDGDIDTVKTYTGYKTVASHAATAVYVVDDAAYIFTIFGDDLSNDSDELIYIAWASFSDEIDDKDLGKYFTVNAIVDGEIVEIMTDDDDYAYLFDGADINEDGIYSFAEDDAVDNDYGYAFGKAKNDVITITLKGYDEDADEYFYYDETFAYADDVAIFVVDEDGNITKGSINKNYSEGVSYVDYTLNDDGEVDFIVIDKQAD